MHNRICPSDQRGRVQGLNIAVVDGAGVVAPFAYGAIADNFGVPACLWTAVAICLGATAINAPLICNSRLDAAQSISDPKMDGSQDSTTLHTDGNLEESGR